LPTHAWRRCDGSVTARHLALTLSADHSHLSSTCAHTHTRRRPYPLPCRSRSSFEHFHSHALVRHCSLSRHAPATAEPPASPHLSGAVDHVSRYLRSASRRSTILLLPHTAATTAWLAAAAAQAVWPLFACLPLLLALHALLLCRTRVALGPEPIAAAPRQFPKAAAMLSIELLRVPRSGTIASSPSCVASLWSSPAGPSATSTYSMCCRRRSP
jgi:hypothetical protein